MENNKASRLFEVLEEVRAEKFPHVSADIVRQLLDIHIGSMREEPPVRETRRLLKDAIRDKNGK